MGLIVIAISVLIIVFVIKCMGKDRSLSGFYKEINVCGRWYAVFTANFLLSGVLSVTAAPVLLVLALMGKLDTASGQVGEAILLVVFLAAAGVGFFWIGNRMYKRALGRCPDELKGRLLKDMVVILAGTSFRIGLIFLVFFFNTWWELSKPTEYVVNGRTVYAFPGSDDLYDGGGNRVGVANSDRTEAVMTDTSYR